MKENLLPLENLVQILISAYIKGNNLLDITPKELIKEMSNKLEPVIKRNKP
ncbi:hypothetical protein [Priestia aryabhattai]|uniref:hypothetical protein n=1 Tax=Priestia aryabhattai TaxID=412384 RepID=UPI001FB3A49F|nr:hypothetical protein [Priestia aryabhattai]